MLSLRTCLVLALAAACGPTPPTMTTDGGPDSTGGSSGGTSATTTPVDPTTGAVSTGDTSAGFMGPPDEGVTFIRPLDGGGCGAFGPNGDLRCKPCDLWTQDCPHGEKCNPYSGDGDDAWESQRCIPIGPDPDHPGEPCSVEGHVASGVDTCDIDSMCWNIDPATLIGECVLRCTGSPDDAHCPDGSACMQANDGVILLCVPSCDPLGDDCPAGERCKNNASDPKHFFCAPDESGDEGQVFDPCNASKPCDPGLTCLESAAATECDPGFVGCCLPWCDLTMPTACPGAMQECVPLFAMDPPPQLAHVGFCSLPP